MFDRLKRALRSKVAIGDDDGSDGLSHWGLSHLMSRQRLSSGAIAIEGLLLDRPFKAGSAPSSRPYIVGEELMARAELDLRNDVNIIVMHRSLKRSLDKAAMGLYAESVEGLRTTDRPLPEELAWLSMYRDVGWPGPSAAFWARYCVLTDNVDQAREWLHRDLIAVLLEATSVFQPATPFLVALTRGKAYMRLQVEALDDGAVTELAMDTLKQLSARAVKLFGR